MIAPNFGKRVFQFQFDANFRTDQTYIPVMSKISVQPLRYAVTDHLLQVGDTVLTEKRLARRTATTLTASIKRSIDDDSITFSIKKEGAMVTFSVKTDLDGTSRAEFDHVWAKKWNSKSARRFGNVGDSDAKLVKELVLLNPDKFQKKEKTDDELLPGNSDKFEEKKKMTDDRLVPLNANKFMEEKQKADPEQQGRRVKKASTKAMKAVTEREMAVVAREIDLRSKMAQRYNSLFAIVHGPGAPEDVLGTAGGYLVKWRPHVNQELLDEVTFTDSPFSSSNTSSRETSSVPGSVTATATATATGSATATATAIATATATVPASDPAPLARDTRHSSSQLVDEVTFPINDKSPSTESSRSKTKEIKDLTPSRRISMEERRSARISSGLSSSRHPTSRKQTSYISSSSGHSSSVPVPVPSPSSYDDTDYDTNYETTDEGDK
jgi:hypothetical protein